MATVTKPIALDESLNTTELSSRNVADVLAQELSAVATAIGGIAVPSADHVSYDNSVSGLSATDVQNALDEIVSDIPTVNNGTLTIQQNGTSKGSFTANSASNVNVNIETPTADKKTATDQFNTADGGLLSKCVIDLVPIQSGSGDPSPDNVRAISGHTEAQLYRVGKNLCPRPADGTYANVVVKSSNDGSVSFIGNCNSNLTIDFYRNPARLPDLIKPNKTYTVSLSNAIDEFNIYYSNDGNTYAYPTLVTLTNTTSATFTVPSNATGLLIRVVVKSGSNYNVTIYPQIEEGSAITAFEPYLGHLYTINLGGTYYGGYLDVVSGEFAVDRGYVDLDSLSWTYRSDLQIFQTTNVGFDYSLDTSKVNISSCYLYNGIKTSGSGAVSVNPSFSLYTSNRYMWIRDTRFTDPTLFTNSLSGQKAVLYLATPQTIQLTPQQIKALVGENNLSCPLEGQSLETNGVEYKELFTFSDVKELIAEKVPDAPTTDGTYTLQAVVSGGVPTYSWT